MEFSMINILIHIHHLKKCALIVYLDKDIPTNIQSNLILLKDKRK